MSCIARQCVLPSLTHKQRERLLAEAAMHSLADLLITLIHRYGSCQIEPAPFCLLASRSFGPPLCFHRRSAIVHRPWRYRTYPFDNGPFISYTVPVFINRDSVY